MSNRVDSTEQTYHFFAGFSGLCIGSVLLYPLDRSIFQAVNFYGGHIKALGMTGAVLIMNGIMLFELFIFITMIFNFFRHCFQKGLKATGDAIEGVNYHESMIRLFVFFFTILSFLGTVAALSYATLHLVDSLICAFFVGLVIPTIYYIQYRYQKEYKNRSNSLLFILRNEVSLLTFLWIWVLSSALAIMVESKSTHFGLAIGLTVSSLVVMLLFARYIDNRLDNQAIAETGLSLMVTS